MKNMPLISVIVPVYYAETYIDNCMNSLSAQTYPELEIILVLDQSSEDKSEEMCDAYEKTDKRIVLKKVKNVKPGVARNAGLDAATGEYIVFLDVDDTLPPNAYEALVNAMMKSGEETDIVYGVRELLIIETGKKTLLEHKIGKEKSVPPYFCGIYKRKYLEDNGIRYTGFRMGEDICFHVQVAASNPRCKYIHDIVYIVHRSMYANSRVVERTTGLFAFKNFGENIKWRKWVCEFSHARHVSCIHFVDPDTYYNRGLLIHMLNYSIEERGIALNDYKGLLAMTTNDISTDSFKSMTGVEYQDFLTMPADEFFIMFLRYLSDARQVMMERCKNGEVGLGYMAKLLLCGLRSKITRKKVK